MPDIPQMNWIPPYQPLDRPHSRKQRKNRNRLNDARDQLVQTIERLFGRLGNENGLLSSDVCDQISGAELTAKETIAHYLASSTNTLQDAKQYFSSQLSVVVKVNDVEAREERERKMEEKIMAERARERKMADALINEERHRNDELDRIRSGGRHGSRRSET